MSAMPDPRFELTKITETEWLILDHRYAPNDARQTVARIYRLDTVEVEVLWLRELPLASYYMSAEDAFDDLTRFSTPSRAKPPITIVHRPPLTATA